VLNSSAPKSANANRFHPQFDNGCAKASLEIEQATSSYSFRSPELSQPILSFLPLDFSKEELRYDPIDPLGTCQDRMNRMNRLFREVL
jgi:hypothetical protein